MEKCFSKIHNESLYTIMLRAQTQSTNYFFNAKTDLSSLDLNSFIVHTKTPDKWKWLYLELFQIRIPGSRMSIWYSWMIFWLKRIFWAPLEWSSDIVRVGLWNWFLWSSCLKCIILGLSPCMNLIPPPPVSESTQAPNMVPQNVPNPKDFQLDWGALNSSRLAK